MQEGSRDRQPRFRDVVPVVMKAVILNEVHFQRTFTFGGIPMCQLPAHFIESEDLLRRYMGEYRDLSTDCSVRSRSNQEVAEVRGVRDLKLVENRRRDGVVKKSGGRARFNWQDRKRFDLKGHPEACKQCVSWSRPVRAFGKATSTFGETLSCVPFNEVQSDWLEHSQR